MKMKHVLILALVAIGGSLQAQNFYDYFQKGDSLLSMEKNEAALAAYEQAFEQREGGHPLFYLNPAVAAAQTGKKEQAYAYLRKAIEKGLDDPETLKKQPGLMPLYSTKEWMEILNELQSKQEDKYEELKAQLEYLLVKDQMVRDLAATANEDKLGKEGMEAFNELYALQDSLNQLEVKRILADYGWPGISQVGEQANKAVWVIVTHGPLAMQEMVLPVLQKSVKAEESKPEHLAMLEDMILVQKEEKQKYGTYLIVDPATGSKSLYPVDDREAVETRRAELGLDPLSQYLEQNGVK
jgi:tetratricopeptide (TPR) repeat protein